MWQSRWNKIQNFYIVTYIFLRYKINQYYIQYTSQRVDTSHKLVLQLILHLHVCSKKIFKIQGIRQVHWSTETNL